METPAKRSEDGEFVIESWNHPAFGPRYTMLWGPFPMKDKLEIQRKIVKNFDKNVKHLSYRISEKLVTDK